MIQSIVIEDTKQVEEQTYPCILKGLSGAIVLFEAYGHGTVIAKGGMFVIGHPSTHWVMENFKRFNGSVTLSNTE